jgi:hypothetical protein
VNIVVIILLQRAQSRIEIEKWEFALPDPRWPCTRANPQTPTKVPTKVHEITIDPNNVTGASLVLEFQKILLRRAIPPETDFILTTQEFSSWATNIWRGF